MDLRDSLAHLTMHPSLTARCLELLAVVSLPSIFISLEQVVTYIVGNALTIAADLGPPTNCSKKLIPQCMDHVRRRQDLGML
jgi:hypothetical protein